MYNSKRIISLLLSVILLISGFSLFPITVSAQDSDIASTEVSGTTGDCTWTLDGSVLTISGNGKMSNNSGPKAPWGNDIKKIVIGTGVTYIETQDFKSCNNLTSITVISNNPEYSSIDGNLYDNDAKTLIMYAVGKSASSFTIPDSVTSIGNGAFVNCKYLTDVNIPDSVISIGKSAFLNCSNLTKVTIGNSVTSIGDGAFHKCHSLTVINIPNSVTSIGVSAFVGCMNLTELTIPDSVKSIGIYALTSTGWYNNQTDGLVYAGMVAYKMKGDCPSKVVIKDDTSSIASGAFSGCNNLMSITIPDSITSIGSYAFSGCTSLTIYGYEGSEAEKYANDNEFNFVTLQSKADKATGIIASVPKDIGLHIVNAVDQLPADGIIKAYDISLTKDGMTVQPDNIINIKIPCDNPVAKVCRKETDGTFTDMNAVYKDGYMVFCTDHFSIFYLSLPTDDTPVLLGDADGSGEVDLVDATVIQRHTTMIAVPYDESQLMCADIDGDGSLTIVDATFIQRYATKVQTPYKIGATVG